MVTDEQGQKKIAIILAKNRSTNFENRGIFAVKNWKIAAKDNAFTVLN